MNTKPELDSTSVQVQVQFHYFLAPLKMFCNQFTIKVSARYKRCSLVDNHSTSSCTMKTKTSRHWLLLWNYAMFSKLIKLFIFIAVLLFKYRSLDRRNLDSVTFIFKIILEIHLFWIDQSIAKFVLYWLKIHQSRSTLWPLSLITLSLAIMRVMMGLHVVMTIDNTWELMSLSLERKMLTLGHTGTRHSHSTVITWNVIKSQIHI